MKIIHIKGRVELIPLSKPYTIAYNHFSNVEILFIEIELSNGLKGYGCSSPAIDVVGIKASDSFLKLQDPFFNQVVVGQDIINFQYLIHSCRKIFFNDPGICCAFDLAMHDAIGKYYKIPLVKYFGQFYDRLPTSVTIGLKNSTETIAEAREYLKQGFFCIKLKIGQSLEQDLERIVNLIEVLPTHCDLRLDANQAYNYLDFVHLLEKIKDYKQITIIEQPFKSNQDEWLRQLEFSSRKKIMADESLINAKQALTLAYQQSFGIFNIKLMKCGGIIAAREIHTIAALSDIDIFWGCNDESILSIAAALHCAFSSKQTKYLDLDGSLDLRYDYFSGGFILKDGWMYLNDEPGLGVSPYPS